MLVTNVMSYLLHSSHVFFACLVYNVSMATLKHMRSELLKAHQEGLADDVHLISEIDTPKDATEVFICYLALEAARGSYPALCAVELIKKYEQEKGK